MNRFYVTLMLYELLKGKSVWDVAAHFLQPRGFLQSLLTTTAAFASCVLRFSQVRVQYVVGVEGLSFVRGVRLVVGELRTEVV